MRNFYIKQQYFRVYIWHKNFIEATLQYLGSIPALYCSAGHFAGKLVQSSFILSLCFLLPIDTEGGEGKIPMTGCTGVLLMFWSQCFGLNFCLKMGPFWKSGRYRWLLITLKAHWSVLEIYVLYEFYYIISHFCEYKSLCPLTLQNQVLR